MINKIKFALLLGDKPCRSLEDVRENFNAEDIIKNFDSGVLLKWLKAYNFEELYNKALLIDKNSESKLYYLLDLFFEDKAKKEELINKYKEEKERLINDKVINYRLDFNFFKLIENSNLYEDKEEKVKFSNDYECIVKSIIENKTNYDFIKDTIFENHKILMEHYSDFFEKLKSEECLFGILSVLANEDTRDYFLNDESIMKFITKFLRRIIRYKFSDKNNYLFSKIKFYDANINNIFTKVVENKKCLIIFIDSDCCITSSKDENKIYSFDDINHKFLILDGINYRNNGIMSNQLIYMEI